VPVVLSVCETNPSTGACLALPTPTVTTTIGAGQTPTFAVFASTGTAIPLDAKKQSRNSAGSRTVVAGPVGRPAWQ
jgi:hypothetical protein